MPSPRAAVRVTEPVPVPASVAVGGSSAERGHEELVLNFMPRIDPLARRLRLTLSGEAEEAAAELDVAPRRRVLS